MLGIGFTDNVPLPSMARHYKRKDGTDGAGLHAVSERSPDKRSASGAFHE